MSMFRKYSVLMSLYSKEQPEHLRKAIDSILNQTIKPDEIIIVKDGLLTSELDDVLNEYQSDHPRIFNIVGYEKNRGLGLALNFGLEHCKNELVARMDTDDIAKPDRCEKQLKMFETNPSLEIVGGDIAEFIDIPTNIVAYRKVPTTDAAIKEYMKTRCPFNHMTVMYKKASVFKSGDYKDLFWNEDYYLWIRMWEHNCVMGNTGDVLVDVRTGIDMYKRRGGKKYFKSEKFLQKYMLERNMISKTTFIMNITKRFIIQRILPSSVRAYVFKKFARN